MRRMYSEQELTKIIKEVSEAYIDELIEDGEFDQEIADYVDAYLVEHPVDITALEGQDVSLATLTSTGNVSVGGALSVSGAITGASIIEDMDGYSFTKGTNSQLEHYYAGVCKNGNKITFVITGKIRRETDGATEILLGSFTIPGAIGSKLIPLTSSWLDKSNLDFFDSTNTITQVSTRTIKQSNDNIQVYLNDVSPLAVELNRYFRYEITFLLSDNLVA